MPKNEQPIEFPSELLAKEAALRAARTAHFEYLRTLPSGWDVEVTDEQRAESARLREGERQAAAALAADGYWAALAPPDRVGHRAALTPTALPE
ncbi:hypothetical protein [Kitasatospora sp. NPDC085879]|uniref:hypothetical protein n=1 Tax=Kitasatospora sp. NPDC085879 TaxID=3154769 RepID=UPI003433D3F6